MVAGHHDDAARITRDAQQRGHLPQSLGGPGHADLIGTGKLRIHGVMDHPDHPLLAGRRPRRARALRVPAPRRGSALWNRRGGRRAPDAATSPGCAAKPARSADSPPRVSAPHRRLARDTSVTLGSAATAAGSAVPPCGQNSAQPSRPTVSASLRPDSKTQPIEHEQEDGHLARERGDDSFQKSFNRQRVGPLLTRRVPFAERRREGAVFLPRRSSSSLSPARRRPPPPGGHLRPVARGGHGPRIRCPRHKPKQTPPCSAAVSSRGSRASWPGVPP